MIISDYITLLLIVCLRNIITYWFNGPDQSMNKNHENHKYTNIVIL